MLVATKLHVFICRNTIVLNYVPYISLLIKEQRIISYLSDLPEYNRFVHIYLNLTCHLKYKSKNMVFDRTAAIQL
jgi:hypothetical protein